MIWKFISSIVVTQVFSIPAARGPGRQQPEEVSTVPRALSALNKDLHVQRLSSVHRDRLESEIRESDFQAQADPPLQSEAERSDPQVPQEQSLTSSSLTVHLTNLRRWVTGVQFTLQTTSVIICVCTECVLPMATTDCWVLFLLIRTFLFKSAEGM
jgi:hypothetical protein